MPKPVPHLRRWAPAVLLGILAALAAWPGPDVQAQERGGYRYSGEPARKRQTPLGPVMILGSRQGGRARMVGDDLQVDAALARRYELLEEIEVVGDVHVVTDSFTLDTDSLRIYERRDEGHAFGSVRVESLDGLLATGDRAIYKQATDWLALMGRARVIDNGVVVSGDSIVYDRPTQLTEAFGQVRVVDEVAGTVVTGEHGRFDRRTGIAVVDSVPELTSRQEEGPDIRVVSRWMSFNRPLGHSRAVGDVEFRQGTTAADADTADFYGRDILVLTGTPRVERDRRVMTGDRIDIHYVQQKLRYIEVMGNARLVDSTPDTLGAEFSSIPLENVLEGDTLEVYLDEDEIKRTYVRGNSRSVYLPEDQEASVSVNEVSGNSIDITFSDRQVDQVKVEGNVEGIYRFLDRPGRAARTELDSLAAEAGVDTSLTATVDSLRTALTDFASSANSVSYDGAATTFEVQDGFIHVSGDARIQYDTLTLTSDTVHYDTANQEMLAEGNPLLVDGDSELVGDRMGYLFDAKTGAVGDGATRFDDGFYYGRHIRRPDKETLLVDGGTYTTCDLAEPHYHFEARKMKLKLGERVVARQVVFKVSNLPLMVFPFYFKSLDSGRHSGILFPNVNLGVSSREGRYIRDFGYYWATNDYTDFRFEIDYNERRDATFTLENRYNVRYGMSGNARFDYLRRFSDTQTGDRWKLVASHNQPELWEVWSARADINLSSSKLENNNLGSQNPNQLIDTQLRSTGSLSRSFDNGARVSLSFSRTQTVNAEDEDPDTNNELYSQSLPGLRLSFKTRPLLPPLRSGEEGNPAANVLRDIQFSQSYSGQWQRNKREVTLSDDVNVSGRYGLNYSPKGRIGPFVYSAGTNFSNRYSWMRDQEFLAADGVVPRDGSGGGVPLPPGLEEGDPAMEVVETESENQMSLSFSNTLRTDLYGIFRTNLGPLTGVKHKVSWSTTHNFSPAIRDQQVRSQRFSFSLTNELSVKLRGEPPKPGSGPEGREAAEGGGTGIHEAGEIEPPGRSQERKIDQMVRWSLSSGFNPEAEPDRQWSDIQSSLLLRSPLPQVSDLQINQTFDAYNFDVIRTPLSTNVRVGGNLDLGGTLRQREEAKNAVIDRLSPAAEDSSTTDPGNAWWEEDDRDRRDSAFSDPRFTEGSDRNAIPWSLNTRVSVTRTLNQTTGEVTTRSNISGGASVRLPGQWSFSWNAGFDAEAGEFTNQFWSLRRDLHNWTLEFNRGTADGTDFGFRLYLRDIPDLEVTRGDRNAGDVWRRLGQ